MDLKHLFIEDCLRNLNKIESIKKESEEHLILADDNKQVFWGILGACLCINWIKKFEFTDNRKRIDNLGVDFNLLFETALKNEFNIDLPIVQDFLNKIDVLKNFIAKLN